MSQEVFGYQYKPSAPQPHILKCARKLQCVGWKWVTWPLGIILPVRLHSRYRIGILCLCAHWWPSQNILGNQQTEAVCALGASLYLGLISRYHSRTCSNSARIQSCDSHTRAAHINHRQWTHLIPRVINSAASHGKLTQNMRLKANIKCLMHVSPPDSAAMVVLMGFRTWSSRTVTEDLQQISPGRMRLSVDAPAMLRASCCARL